MATNYTYDKKKDYQAMINEAADAGDYRSAALYEQQRNQKIDDLNAAKTNYKNHQKTNNYSQYLNGGTNTAQGYLSEMASYGKADIDSDNYDKWQKALEQYQNNKFEYDFDSDPQKASYEANAQKNYENTLAQTSARTGGLASSYAGQASQQAYQDTMTQAYQILYNLAKEDFDSEQTKTLNTANQYWNAYQNDLDLSNTDWERMYSLYGLVNDQETAKAAADATAAENEKESALMAAYGGDYSRFAKAYGITEDQAKAYLASQMSTGSSGSSGGSSGRSSGSSKKSSSDSSDWESAREKMYAAGVSEADAYNWLVDHDYSSTEAKQIAESYSDKSWRYAQSQKTGENLGVAAKRLLSMIEEGIVTDEAQALRLVEGSTAMTDSEKEYLRSLIQ